MSTTPEAVSRYQYLLRTANPSQIEQAHEQAFAAMTPTERAEVLRALSTTAEVPTDASASSLARSATRLEVQQPGALQRVLGNQASLGTTLLASLAAGFVGSAAWSSVTGGDGVGGRPGLLARLLGLGSSGGLSGFGRSNGWFGDRGGSPGFFGGDAAGGRHNFFSGPGGPGGRRGPGGGGPGGGGPGGGGPGGGGPGGGGPGGGGY